MPDIYRQAQSFRANLLKRDTAAVAFLTDQYREVYARLLRLLTVLNNQIAEQQRQGQAVSWAWLNRQERYQSLLRDMDREFQRYGNTIEHVVTARQFVEARQAVSDSLALMDAGASVGVQASFNRLPALALENIVANLRTDSPLGKLLARFGDAASRRVSDALRDAVALGYNPRKVAREVRDVLGVPLARALLISRTESLRAYRQATLNTYQANRDAISGWTWVASKSARTCLNCLARDGDFYTLNKPFPAHPSCRCTAIPALKDAPQSKRETAGQWFERQPDAVKQAMMSGIGFDLYKQGKIKLRDFAGAGYSRQWGPFTYERSVKEILADKRKRA